MANWLDYSKEELLAYKKKYREEYDALRALNLDLNLSRGKPSPDVLDLSNELLGALDDYKTEAGVDIRNYALPTGLPEAKRLFSELLDIPQEQLILGGNASLSQMYNIYSFLYLFGVGGHTPWSKLDSVKILCPCPGYDRHFSVSEDFGSEMIVVPMNEDGPDMDIIEELVAKDESIKGIWCVPTYSNPTGVVYSDEVVKRLASMETKAPDFKIFWDNAYGVHHVYEEHKLANIMDLAREATNEDRILYFFSTSKITFPGGGMAIFASSPTNIAEFTKHISKQTIGYDKIIQKRTVNMFKDAKAIRGHMQEIAKIFRPKFDLVLDFLNTEFKGTGILEWIEPKGGYFVSIDTLDGCAKAVVKMAKDAGVVLTGAGATYPYKKDPNDKNIRIAPTYPDINELRKTMEVLTVCIKLISIDKLLSAL